VKSPLYSSSFNSEVFDTYADINVVKVSELGLVYFLLMRGSNFEVSFSFLQDIVVEYQVLARR
jgi:hypothetical protein